MDYEKFIENKAIAIQSVGFEVDRSDLNPMLFNYQKDIVRWALMKGRAGGYANLWSASDSGGVRPVFIVKI